MGIFLTLSQFSNIRNSSPGLSKACALIQECVLPAQSHKLETETGYTDYPASRSCLGLVHVLRIVGCLLNK